MIYGRGFYGPDLAVATSLLLICNWLEDSQKATSKYRKAGKCSSAIFGRKRDRFGEHVAASVKIPNLDAAYQIF